MLTCYMCGETKPGAEFAFADMANGTRQRHCRKCQAAYRRAHYLANRDDYIRREVARIDRYRVENRALMLAYLLAHPCVDCGEADPIKLEFDHRDPAEKKGNVSELAMRKPWRLVLIEVVKCDVRCANCHLRRTAQQFNWRKAQDRAFTGGTSRRRELPTDGDASTSSNVGEIRKCTGCGLEKAIGEFCVKDRKTGRRGTRCRECRSTYGKLHYRKNRDKYMSRRRNQRNRGTARDRYWSWLMTYLASHPCVDCGETDPVVLQFDHRNGTTKLATVGALLSRASWGDLLREIGKCEVRCANCHRLRTAQQFGWSKWIRETA